MTVIDLDRYANSPVTPLLNTYRENLLDFDMLQTVPEPTWLVEGYLLADSLAVIWGDPSAGKSFIALDWAMSIATNTPWFGHRVTPGNVLYILGEGTSGMKLRANAWVSAHGQRPYADQLLFLKRPVKLLEEYAVELVTQLAKEQRQVSLIVIDTLARAIVGHSENDSTDMGKLVEVAEQIREATKATILFIHHAGKGNGFSKSMRGSSALKGAVDTEIEMTVDDPEGHVTDVRYLYCRKQKDAPPFSQTSVYLQKRELSLVPGQNPFGGI